MADRQSLDATAVSVTVLLALAWGIGHVAAKLAAPGLSLVFQAGLRSVIATVLLLGWCVHQNVPLWHRDGTLGLGLLSGLLFAIEFLFSFSGLARTDAARMVVFVYLQPCLSALALHFLVPQERLNARQGAGIAVAFAGLALAFGDGLASGRGTLLGDFFGIMAAVFWAALTVLVRATKLGAASPAKVLFYQLAISGPPLLLASWALGEPGVIQLTPAVVAAFAYQCIVVAFISFLAWFWLFGKYLAYRLGVFTFLTPLFGVLGGVFVLGEPLTPGFATAAALVGAGILLVNLKKA